MRVSHAAVFVFLSLMMPTLFRSCLVGVYVIIVVAATVVVVVVIISIINT